MNPTVLLFAGAVGFFVSGIVCAVSCDLPGWTVVILIAPLQVLAICAAYTVGHDAAHHIASRNRFLNETMLILCSVVFLFEPYLFRRLHLTHHAHTDESDDPDLFTSGRNWPMRILRSSMLHIGYYSYAFQHWRHDGRWKAHVFVGPLIPVIIAGIFVLSGNSLSFVIVWLAPLAIAGSVLGLLISSAPHDATTHTTRNLKLPVFLRWILGNGHLHLAHHVAPTVPWYRLPAFWREFEHSSTTRRGRLTA